MTLSSISSLTLRKTPRISDAEFADLRGFIYDVTGIDIPERRQYLLENRLGARLAELNLKSFAEYSSYLRRSPSKDKELVYLCEKITTNETSFFRDSKQLDVFRDFVLKDVLESLQQDGRKELNIWSAGCSSGEEPYTLGIMLHEMLRMSIIGWRIRISANDISTAMLNKAKDGVYNQYSFKTTPQEMIEKYFTKEPGGFKIHPKVQRLVSFAALNLNDRMALKRVPKSQIIFCRNVIIYFDEEMKKKVINAFYDNLLPGGYLILGHSESIHKFSRVFKPIIKPGGMFYRKEG